METFFSETFIKLVLSNQTFLKRFVKTNPEFGSRKFDLKDVFDAHMNIEETAKFVMLDTIYHDLPKVREMYRETFELNFPSIGDAIKCVKVRHDLVHRNGKSKAGVDTILNLEVISQTMDVIINLVKAVSTELKLAIPEIDFTDI